MQSYGGVWKTGTLLPKLEPPPPPLPNNPEHRVWGVEPAGPALSLPPAPGAAVSAASPSLTTFPPLPAVTSPSPPAIAPPQPEVATAVFPANVAPSMCDSDRYMVGAAAAGGGAVATGGRGGAMVGWRRRGNHLERRERSERGRHGTGRRARHRREGRSSRVHPADAMLGVVGGGAAPSWGGASLASARPCYTIIARGTPALGEGNALLTLKT